jgi:hypothetical protein
MDLLGCSQTIFYKTQQLTYFKKEKHARGIGVFPGIAGIIADRTNLETISVVLFALSIMMMILYEMIIHRSSKAHEEVYKNIR